MRFLTTLLATLLAVALLQDRAPAQGDDCPSATPIAGSGTFGFNLAGATPSGTIASCALAPHNDVWFEWTPDPFTEYRFQVTLGNAFVALFDACGGPELACGDRGFVVAGITPGAAYRIRLSGEAVFTPLLLEIAFLQPNDECTDAVPITGTGAFPFDTRNATGDLPLPFNDVWYRWTAPLSLRYEITTVGGTTFNSFLAVLQGADCAGLTTVGISNDYNGLLQSRVTVEAVAGQDYWIAIGSPGPTGEGLGTFSVNLLGAPGPVGTVYCTSPPNSSGAASTLTANGFQSAALASLRLQANNLPATVFGIFYFGSAQISVPYGGGIRCVGGVTRRLPITASDAAGVMVSGEVFTGANATVLVANSTWNFQLWHRDPGISPLGTGANFSDALVITFLP